MHEWNGFVTDSFEVIVFAALAVAEHAAEQVWRLRRDHCWEEVHMAVACEMRRGFVIVEKCFALVDKMNGSA